MSTLLESYRGKKSVYKYIFYINTNPLCIVLVYTKFSRNASIVYIEGNTVLVLYGTVLIDVHIWKNQVIDGSVTYGI